MKKVLASGNSSGINISIHQSIGLFGTLKSFFAHNHTYFRIQIVQKDNWQMCMFLSWCLEAWVLLWKNGFGSSVSRLFSWGKRISDLFVVSVFWGWTFCSRVKFEISAIMKGTNWDPLYIFNPIRSYFPPFLLLHFPQKSFDSTCFTYTTGFLATLQKKYPHALLPFRVVFCAKRAKSARLARQKTRKMHSTAESSMLPMRASY